MLVCEHAEICENICIAPDVFSLLVKVPEIADTCMPGSFVTIACDMPHSLLRRPFSICDAQHGSMRIVYEIHGKGTDWLSHRKAGEMLNILGPLGHGYDIKNDGKYILVGGGMGCAPLLFAARMLENRATGILGFRNDKKMILADEFSTISDSILIATDDGSFGIHGSVTIPLENMLCKDGYCGVLACGPKPMLKAVANLCEKHNMPCQVSMEEHMACGMGACLGCVCETKNRDGERKMSRVCHDGPVFDSKEVVW